MMENDTSFQLFDRFRQGDEQAAALLFDRYVSRLTALARSRMSAHLERRVAAEDVVQSVYGSFFVRAREGQYALEQSGDLWRLLAAITLNKVYRQVSATRPANAPSMPNEAFKPTTTPVSWPHLPRCWIASPRPTKRPWSAKIYNC